MDIGKQNCNICLSQKPIIFSKTSKASNFVRSINCSEYASVATVLICQLSNVFAFREGKKRLKGESSILSWFHFSNFFVLSWVVFFCEFFSAVIEGRIFKSCVCSRSHFFHY